MLGGVHPVAGRGCPTRWHRAQLPGRARPGDRQLMGLMDIEEFPTNVRPAGRFADPSGSVGMVEAGIAIGLQGASEDRQVLPRMLARSIRDVVEEHGRLLRAAGQLNVPDVGPQPPGSRPAFFGRQRRHQRVVGMQLCAAHHVCAQPLEQRGQQRGTTADPVGECRSLNLDAIACVDIGLPVQR